MSIRPQYSPYRVIPNAAASPANSSSMGASITSAPTIIQKLSMISYEVDWAAGSTPVGSLSIEVSNSYSLNQDGSVHSAGTWTTMTLSYNGSSVTSIPVSGNSGNAFIDIDATGAYAMRLVYTRVSGTGSLTATVSGKVA